MHRDELARLHNPVLMQASNPVSWQYRVGGVATNAAIAASRVCDDDSRIVLTAAVGTDSVAGVLQSAVQANGPDVVKQSFENTQTGRYSAIFDESGELLIGLSDVALAERLTIEHLSELADQLIPNAILVDTNLSTHCLRGIAHYCHQSGIQLGAIVVSPAKAGRLTDVAELIDTLYCNRQEAMSLTSSNMTQNLSLEDLSNRLLQAGFTQFVLTDAGHDLIVQRNNDRHRIRVPPRVVEQSVNGAGDALAGASFTAYARQLPLQEAVEHYGLAQASCIIDGSISAVPLPPADRP